MIREMIQAKIDGLFNELETLSNEMVEIETKKRNTSSIRDLSAVSLNSEREFRILSISTQLQMLVNIGGRQ